MKFKYKRFIQPTTYHASYSAVQYLDYHNNANCGNADTADLKLINDKMAAASLKQFPRWVLKVTMNIQ